MKVAGKSNFILFKCLDTFVEYVKLLNEKQLPENQTDTFAYLRHHFDDLDIAERLEIARQEGTYHKAFMVSVTGQPVTWNCH